MDASTNPRIAIAGTGAVGRALAKLLIAIDKPAAYIVSRELGKAETVARDFGQGLQGVSYDHLPSDTSHLLLAVPDATIQSIAALFGGLTSLQVAVHTAGGLSLGALNVLAVRGVSTAILHPLQTMPKGETVPLDGAVFTVLGSGLAADWSEQIVRKARGQLLRIAPEHQSLYHAAAVMASNQLLALLDSSEYLLRCAGIAPEQARQALRPLVTRTMEGGLRAGPIGALTGPIARGDAETVRSHLTALEGVPSDIKKLYISASNRLAIMAKRGGLPPESVIQVEAALMMDN